MPDKKAPEIQLIQRIKLISEHACFFSLSQQDIKELASLSYDKTFLPDEIIIQEEDIIDAVYLIANGSVEVSKQLKTSPNKPVPITTLEPGDAIGLSHTGFFAEHGIRTATLTALSRVNLIGWRLDDFYQFIKKHPAMSACMQQTAEIMLRINFIKQVTPFTHLPTKYLSDISRKIEEIDVENNTIIFNEGDRGDNCYLIYSGKVEISTKNEDGTDRILSILQEKMIFGELSILSNLPRNATAKMVESGKLLVINKNQIKKIVAKFQPAADALLVLALERTRPIRIQHISIFEKTTDDGQLIAILKNNEQKVYFQLSSVGLFIWNLLDGKHTIEDIAIAVFNEFHLFIPNAVTDTIFNLANAGFISTANIFFSLNQRTEQPYTNKFKLFLNRFLFIRFLFNNIDPFIDQTYNNFIYLLYKPPAQFILLLIASIGCGYFVVSLQTIISIIPQSDHLALILLVLYFTYFACTIFHELAHAYTTKAYGYEVNRAGMVFYWLGMFSFTDTSDMWLSNSKKRSIVSLVGPYTDCILAGIVSIIAYFITSSHGNVSIFLWLLALLLYVSAFKNLNPINDGDGTAILTDTLNHPHLKNDAIQWFLSNKLSNSLSLLVHINHRDILIFWISTFVFLLVAILFALITQHYLRLLLPSTIHGISTTHLSWLLPAYVVCCFCLTLWRSIKQLKAN